MLKMMSKTKNDATLFIKTPIRPIRVNSWEEKELVALSDEELLQRALKENKEFCISPATYAMIERRFLERTLQQMINPNVGFRQETLNFFNSK